MKLLSEITGLANINEHPVFSPQRFDSITLGDAALQRQLIESFLNQRASIRENLTRSARAGEQQFADALHQLKAICHFTAAERMQRILRAIDDADPLKDEAGRMLAAQAMLEGLDELGTTLAGVCRSETIPEPVQRGAPAA